MKSREAAYFCPVQNSSFCSSFSQLHKLQVHQHLFVLMSVTCPVHMKAPCGAQNGIQALKAKSQELHESIQRTIHKPVSECVVKIQKSSTVANKVSNNLEVLTSLSKCNLVCIYVKRWLTWTLTVPWGSCTCSRVASTSSATTNPDVNLRGLSDSPVGSMIFAVALWSY